MLYVVLSVICMSMLILSVKIAGIRGANNNHVVLWNYIIAFAVTMIVNIAGGKLAVLKELGSLNMRDVFTEKNLAVTAFLVLVTGFVSGISFPTNLIEIKDSTAVNGSGISAFFKQMSTIGGLLIAVAFMGERPSSIQWLGIALMTVAIVMMVYDFKSLKIEKGILLILIFVTGSIMETGNKVISKYTIDGYSMIYLSMIFFVATIYIIIYMSIKEKDFKGFSKLDIFYGAILGMSNLGNNFCKIKALNVLPAAVVIPIVAAGSLILTNLVSIIFFKEKANKLYGAAVVIAVISIFLLNM